MAWTKKPFTSDSKRLAEDAGKVIRSQGGKPRATDGPYSERPAYDTVGLALSGIASLFLDPDKPQITGPTIPDNTTTTTITTATSSTSALSPSTVASNSDFSCLLEDVQD